jgi:WD repeat-containing protein 25
VAAAAGCSALLLAWLLQACNQLAEHPAVLDRGYSKPRLAMDLLSAAYGGTSDDEDAADPPFSTSVATGSAFFAPPPLKRPWWESHRYLPPTHCLPQQPLLKTAAPLASPSSGRYVSKRERALLPSSQAHVESGSPLPPLTGVEFDCTGELSGPSLQQI